MNFFQLLGLGYRNYIKGIRFLIEHKLYWFMLFPLVLFAGIYWIGLYFASVEHEIGNEMRERATEIDSLRGVTWMTIKMLFFDALNMIFTKFTLYIVVIVLSPLLASLSARIEKIITGNKYKFNLRQLIRDIKRGIQIALRNLFWEYFFIIIVLGIASFFDSTIKNILIFFIPVTLGFYFYGFAFLDYINERRRLNIQQSVYFVSKHRGLAIAIGSVYYILFLTFFYVLRNYAKLPSDTSTQVLWGTILVVTFILAAVAPILAITSATLSMHDLVDLSKNEYALRDETQTIEENETELLAEEEDEQINEDLPDEES